jgi:hypothetical protein
VGDTADGVGAVSKFSVDQLSGQIAPIIVLGDGGLCGSLGEDDAHVTA